MSYSAIRARTALLVLLPCTIFSVRVAKADPTTPPPSPFHEILIADDLNNIGTSRLRGECDLINGSTFHFVATGRAVGPYPGTFVERGTFELSPALPSTFGNIVINVTSFRARFRVDSPVGIVTGRKTIVSDPSDRGQCGNLTYQNSPNTAASMRALVTYVARVESRPTGHGEPQVACYTGNGFVQYGDVQLRGTPNLQEFSFGEPFLTSTPTACDDGEDEENAQDEDGD